MDNLNLQSDSLDQTISIGKRLGSNLKGSEVIELLSDLGGGKTSLVKGIAIGAHSSDLVSSPSFTLCNQYTADKFNIYHFDFYRLSDPGIIRRELEEAITESNNVVIVEWPEVIENSLPEERLVIEITAENVNKRNLTIKVPKNLEYLIRGLK